jgi:predicted MPP superfamily phosphohydrolase
VLLAALVAGTACFSWWQNNGVTVTRVELHAALPKAFDGLRVLLVSDLHNKQFGEGQARLVAKLAPLQPDLIAVAGDLYDKRYPGTVHSLAFIDEAVRLAPVYFVPGNHEASLPACEALCGELRQHGVTVLQNEGAYFERNGERLALLGLESRDVFIRAYGRAGAHRAAGDELARLMREYPAAYQILLSHHPEMMPST